MFGREITSLTLTKCQSFGHINFPILKGLRFMSNIDTPNSGMEEEEKEPPSLKQWRPYYDTTHKLATKMKIFDRGSRPNMDFVVMMNGPWDLTRSGVSKWWKKKVREVDIHDQRFVPERHEILGSNLAAAHFLVHRGGKVRFLGHSDWVKQDENEEYPLPNQYKPDYFLEAIDANGINLYYEGLINLRYLHYLKYVSFRGCKPIDDWCLDRISTLFPNIQHLDISNCENVTERGLEALYRTKSLKKLVVTNWYKSAAFDLTCFMLEDCNPDLQCDIRPPEEKSEEELKEQKSET